MANRLTLSELIDELNDDGLFVRELRQWGEQWWCFLGPEDSGRTIVSSNGPTIFTAIVAAKRAYERERLHRVINRGERKRALRHRQNRRGGP